MFTISKRRGIWVMSLEKASELTERYDRDYNNHFYDQLNKLVVELENHPNARRMAYDQWWWRDKSEMDKFITYWTLKQGRSL